MRTVFREQMKELEVDLQAMTESVIEAIERSVQALRESDVNTAEQIRRGDQKINDLRWKIEDNCIEIIARQQPVASDLREVIAVIHIITDLERMGDYAAGIARLVLKLNGAPPVKPLIDIPRMAKVSMEMARESMTAFAERDDEAARRISARDEEIDELYHQIQRELIAIMLENPRTITHCTYYLWASHNLERIGDRVTNICERIIYLVTGEMVENIPPDSRT